jgi:protein-S-isoprenylcysteine O-methyltransferase Ste14
MHILYEYLFPVLWIAYLLFWQIMAANVKATQRMEPVASRVRRTVLFFAGVALLIEPNHLPRVLDWHFLQVGRLSFFLGAAITAAGLLFSVWARLHLGRNWSRSVTIKEAHELIVTGPYALVRHPIYTGLLTAFLGSAIATTELRGILALALIFVSLWMKLRLEEQWMREHFGASYQSYCRRVAALVPFLL